MYKKISYFNLIKKLESHNKWFKGFNGMVLFYLAQSWMTRKPYVKA